LLLRSDSWKKDSFVTTKKLLIMAEIKIEKKKPVWPWILVALVVIGLLIYFLTDNNRDDGRYDRQQVTPTSQLFDDKDSVLIMIS
jgi:hypothetical protein